jgi:hypothetical protein
MSGMGWDGGGSGTCFAGCLVDGGHVGGCVYVCVGVGVGVDVVVVKWKLDGVFVG